MTKIFSSSLSGTAALLLSAAVLSSCASSGGGSGQLVLVNGAEIQFQSVSVSPAGAGDWEPLLEGPLLPGSTRGVSSLAPGLYDFRGVFPGGEAEDDGVRIPAGGRVEIFRE